MSIKRMSQELARLEALPLRKIIDEMVEYQSNKVVLTFHGSDQKPAAAVALITGPQTEAYVQALEQAEADTTRASNHVAARELIMAAEKLRDDLLVRGDTDTDGTRVVNASDSTWCRFNDAIDAANLAYNSKENPAEREAG